MNQAVPAIINLFGGNMAECEGSSKINVTEKVHSLFLSGLFFAKYHVLAKA